ncbi:MAG: hypothetical protein ISS33_04960, partial [Candidatus Omnitrophica bacterium]|nr:hypothetical protein [Candidatus Omnitrophota bacterium]
KRGDYMVVAGDLRPSTERIMIATAIGILESGNKVDYIGKVATPVAALYGLLNNMAVSVVTGSHIPIEDNGEKFYRANGELWKEEEPIFFQYIEDAYKEEYMKTWEESLYDKEGWLKSDEDLILYGRSVIVFEATEAIKEKNANKRAIEAGEKTALELYEERLLKGFGRSLEGIKIAFWEQTTVDRDYSPNRLRGMGADVVIVGRMNEAKEFLALDTEDVKEKYRKMAEAFMNQTGRDVLITKDGDGDRPAVFVRLKNGEVVFIPGDKLNVLAALLLKPKRFSIPKTANYVALSVLEDAGIEIDYNNVGSPYIDLSMMEYLGFDTDGKTGAYGCEVNGGGFIGDKEFSLPAKVVKKLKEFNNGVQNPFGKFTGELSRLSTRGAGMPIVAALLLAKINGETLPELYEETFSGKYESETGALLVENVSETKCTPGCEAYTKEMGKAIIESFSPSDATIEEVKIDDEMRVTAKHIGDAEFIGAKNPKEIKAIIKSLEKYLTQIPGLEEEKISKIVFKVKGKSVGIHNYFTNGERIILRPSGNAAQLRGYTLAKTLRRIKEINDVLERPNTGILVQIIQDFAKGSVQTTETQTSVSDETPFTVGMFAATAVTQSEPGLFEEAIRKMDGEIHEGKVLEMLPFLKTAREGYSWGEPILPDETNERGSFILELSGAETDAKKIALMRKAYNISSAEMSDEDLLKEIKVISESWIGNGDVEVEVKGGKLHRLLGKFLAFLWPHEVFGREHLAKYGMQSAITPKILTSSKHLSLQMHTFDEMFIPLEKGKAFLGFKKDVTAEEVETACMEGKIQDILEEVDLEPGVPIIVRAYTPHAYQAVRIYEVKAVTAAEDQKGTISFFDRLKFLEERDSLKMTAKELKELNPEKRWKKDMLTMTQEQLKATRAWLKQAELMGALQKIDVDKLEFSPSTTRRGEKSQYTIMGRTDRFVSVKYMIEQNDCVGSLFEMSGKEHILFVTEGEVIITAGDGKVIGTLKKGRQGKILANTGEYTMKAVNGKAVVYTQYAPDTEESINVAEVEQPLNEEKGRYAAMGGVTDSGMAQYIEIDDSAPAPAIIGERTHVLFADMGDFSIEIDGEVLRDTTGEPVVFKEDTSVMISPKEIIDRSGRIFSFPTGRDTAVEYKLVKRSLGPVKVGVRYDNTEDEKDVCSAWKAVAEERKAIAKEKYAFIAPKAMYVAGEGPGSRKWEKDQLNEYLQSKDCFDINMYNSKFGLTGSSVRRIITNAVSRGRIPLLVATQKLFDDASKDEDFRNFLKENKVRLVPPIPSLDKLDDDQGWFFTREVEGKALLQGLLTVDSIEAKDAFARKVQKVVSQSLRRYVDINELYYLVGFGDDKIPAAYRPKSTLEWMVYMINSMLQRMKIKAYNPHEELEKQRRTMYSA